MANTIHDVSLMLGEMSAELKTLNKTVIELSSTVAKLSAAEQRRAGAIDLGRGIFGVVAGTAGAAMTWLLGSYFGR